MVPLSAFWPPNVAKVRLAGGHVHPVIGKGTVNVQTPSGEIKSIYEVPYVPHFCKSLFLVGSIVNQGHVIILDDKGYVIKLTSSHSIGHSQSKSKSIKWPLQVRPVQPNFDSQYSRSSWSIKTVAQKAYSP